MTELDELLRRNRPEEGAVDVDGALADVHTRHRRGVRRRIAALGAACVVIVAVGGVVVAQRGTDDAQVATGNRSTGRADDPDGAGSGDGRPIEADTSWDSAVLSADGMTLEIEVGSQPEGDGPCEQRFLHEVVETDEAVTVAFDLQEPTRTDEEVACTMALRPQQFTIELREPVGDRDVYDGVDPAPKTVSGRATIVRATTLPDGVTVDDLDAFPNVDRGERAWSQFAEVPSGPGWDLWIEQQEEGSFTPPETDPTAVIRTLEIHGSEATMYEYFNSTGHMIHWAEGGLDITVRAELHSSNMDEPTDFSNPSVGFIDDELTAVAEGVVIP